MSVVYANAKDGSRIALPWPAEVLKKWVEERCGGEQSSHLPKIERLEWRDYNSSWYTKFWDLYWKRGTYIDALRELNTWQAAKIMDLEMQIRFHKERWEALKPSFKISDDLTEQVFLSGLEDSRYLKDTK